MIQTKCGRILTLKRSNVLCSHNFLNRSHSISGISPVWSWSWMNAYNEAVLFCVHEGERDAHRFYVSCCHLLWSVQNIFQTYILYKNYCSEVRRNQKSQPRVCLNVREGKNFLPRCCNQARPWEFRCWGRAETGQDLCNVRVFTLPVQSKFPSTAYRAGRRAAKLYGRRHLCLSEE